MGLHKHRGTMHGALTPICNECGVSLCWDIEENEALENQAFWDQWICQDCNGGERMSLSDWKASWQPISTAPTDGTEIAVIPNFGYDRAFFQDGFWFWSTSDETSIAAGTVPQGWKPLRCTVDIQASA